MSEKVELDSNFNKNLLRDMVKISKGNYFIIKKWALEAVNQIAHGCIAEAKNGFSLMEVDLRSMYLKTKNSDYYFNFSIGEFHTFRALVIQVLESDTHKFKTTLGGDILTISWL